MVDGDATISVNGNPILAGEYLQFNRTVSGCDTVVVGDIVYRGGMELPKLKNTNSELKNKNKKGVKKDVD